MQSFVLTGLGLAVTALSASVGALLVSGEVDQPVAAGSATALRTISVTSRSLKELGRSRSSAANSLRTSSVVGVSARRSVSARQGTRRAWLKLATSSRSNAR